jgi:hypothetical protein
VVIDLGLLQPFYCLTVEDEFFSFEIGKAGASRVRSVLMFFSDEKLTITAGWTDTPAIVRFSRACNCNLKASGRAAGKAAEFFFR